jgi:hypothetical protein
MRRRVCQRWVSSAKPHSPRHRRKRISAFLVRALIPALSPLWASSPACGRRDLRLRARHRQDGHRITNGRSTARACSRTAARSFTLPGRTSETHAGRPSDKTQPARSRRNRASSPSTTSRFPPALATGGLLPAPAAVHELAAQDHVRRPLGQARSSASRCPGARGQDAGELVDVAVGSSLRQAEADAPEQPYLEVRSQPDSHRPRRTERRECARSP